MADKKTCEELLDDFSRWVYESVLKMQPEQDKATDEIAKEVIKKILPDFADQVDNIKAIGLDTRAALEFMSEFCKRIVVVMDNLCPVHRQEMLESLIPLVSEFMTVANDYGSVGMDMVEEEKQQAEQAKNRLDGTDLNMN